MEIQVTADHIKHGLRGSCLSDPVALALTDAGFGGVYVGFGKIKAASYKMLKQYYEWPTPDAAMDFLFKFDNEEICQPFSFILEV